MLTVRKASATANPRFPLSHVRNPQFLSFALFITVAAVYFPAVSNGFVNFDDPIYVSQNPKVLSGLNWENCRWAFRNLNPGLWHPLTWLSLMLDRESFGPGPWGFHFTNLLLHAGSTSLLFATLRRMTGSIWRSGFVAALFGLHPLHVESVAWISERKDVLSTFFLMMTLWSYARYVEQLTKHQVKEPQGEMESEARKQSCKHHTGVQLYIYTFLLFAFGLMSKPMVVTIPFLMLLLDFWPLGRLQFSTVRGLFFEKVPFVLVSLMIGLLTVHSQKDFGAVGTVAQFPLMMRLGNAALSYVSYLAQTFWPIKMAAFYPYPTRLPLWSILGATLLLIAISIFVLQRMRRQPYLFVGWFWYLAALAPAIGLIQVGTQSRADRYSYVPLIGVFLAVTWFVSGILERWRHHSTVLPSLAFGILGTMIVITHGQIGYWKDGETLWAHALVVTKNNSTALCNYGRALERKGLQAQADEYYEQALRIEPGSLVANVNLGVARLEQGDALAASNHLARAVLMRSGLPVAHLNFARALVTLKNWAEAEKQFDLAAKADPKSYSVQTAWGECLVLQGEIEEASQHFEKALRLEANSPEDQAQLGMDRALKKTGAESSAYYRVVLRLQPDRIDALNNFAWLLATDSNPEVRNGRLAIQHAKKACELTQFRVPQFLGTLGAAYAENGQFDHASETAEKAVVSAEAAGDSNLVARNRELLGLYKAGKAYHEQSP